MYDRGEKRVSERGVVFRVLYLMGMAGVILFLLLDWKEEAEPEARWTPDYEREDLAPILEKGELTDADYRFLFRQTGISEGAVRELLDSGRSQELYRYQNYFFEEPSLVCVRNSPVSWEEEIAACPGRRGETGGRIADLEDGDILITPCSHTFGWRNGHAALVVDAQSGKTLEAVVLGEDSCIQTVHKWEAYPSFMVLRLSGASREERARIARDGKERLLGVPYGFAVGLLSPKHPSGKVTQTHCSHLIWEAYREFGYDLDGNGGRVVTPRDIANSPLLEVRQVCGMDPQRLWRKRV